MLTVAIHCAYDKMVPVAKLKPNPANPNRHPASQIKLLAKIISVRGWRAPITVSNRSGLIVRGHGRLEAALRLGLKKCPVDFQDYESDEAELALGIRTWISIEPVIYPRQALEVIWRNPFVDKFKVGKLNHMPEVEAIVNWQAFLDDLMPVLESTGRHYYIKNDLWKFASEMLKRCYSKESGHVEV